MARIPTFLSDPGRRILPQEPTLARSTSEEFGAGVGEAVTRSGAAAARAVTEEGTAAARAVDQAGTARARAVTDAGTGLGRAESESPLGRAVIAGGKAYGEAQEAFGISLEALGVAGGPYMLHQQEMRDKSAKANAIANFDFTKDFLDLQKTAPPDGSSYIETVASTYDAKVDAYVDRIPSDTVRAEVKQHLMAQKPNFVTAAAQFQNKAAVATDRQDADAGLETQLNRVRSDGSIDTYNDALAKSAAVIDSRPNLLPTDKNAMKKASAEQLAMRRFEGLISNAAQSPEQLDALKTELTVENSVWKSRMSSKAYDTTLDKIDTLYKAANTQEATAARAALGSVKQRIDGGQEVDQQEMSNVQTQVQAAKNPALLSQFAMLNRANGIYRDNKGLPLDQQRAKIDEMKKTAGITALPETVQTGITGGVQITGGQISAEYLAGLVNAEYGHNMAGGDYGKTTGNRNSEGKIASDATGIAQFTSPTFIGAVRAHATELGVSAATSNAAVLEMRKEPGFALKVAALHALDNKRVLEGELGRPVNDGDLYFSHFLGVGGARRFLQAADQNPRGLATTSVDKAQVDANRQVFYDENGVARTNAQVRSYIADATMNGPSRVDYAGVKAATLVYENTKKGLKDDPISYARSTGRFADMGDISTPQGLARRGIVAQQVAEYYNIPSANLKPLSNDEADALAKRAKDGTADETLAVMRQIQGLGNGDVVRAANKQIGEKDSLFGHAAGLAYSFPDQSAVAADIIRGEKRMKIDKDLATTLGDNEPNRILAFNKIVGKALYGFNVDDASATLIRKAADAFYAERYLARGSAKQGEFDGRPGGDYDKAIQAVLGGAANPDGKAIDNVNGAPMALPRGMGAAEFTTALGRMAVDDYSAASKFGGPPRYKDGSTVKPDEIAREGRFEAIGGGEYLIKMSDGKYLVSGVYKDGSSNNYVFRANPDVLRSVAQRAGAPEPPRAPPLDAGQLQ